MAWLILLIVAWGALAFGAIYDWARWPLLIACVVAGAWGFARAVPRERRGVNRPILLVFTLVALAVCVQLVPLESRTIGRWSPATHEFLKQYDLRYALPSVGAPFDSQAEVALAQGREALASDSDDVKLRHPLSIDPPKTWVGLSMLAGLGFMLLGLARGIGGRDLRVFAPGIVALGVLMSMIGIVHKALWSGKGCG